MGRQGSLSSKGAISLVAQAGKRLRLARGHLKLGWVKLESIGGCREGGGRGKRPEGVCEVLGEGVIRWLLPVAATVWWWWW